MQVNRRVDVDGINVRVLDELLKLLVPLRDLILVSDFVQLIGRTLADSVHVGVRMPLVDRHDLLAKSETYNCDVYLFLIQDLRSLTLMSWRRDGAGVRPC